MGNKKKIGEKMNNYIGVKLVRAEEMTMGAFKESRDQVVTDMNEFRHDGYRVHYSDDYVSWCPKEQFEKQNLQIEKPDSISQSDVDSFVGNPEVSKIGEKTVLAIFRYGNMFEQIESSACVDPKNFSMEIGTEICVNRAKDKVWSLLGFLLQCAKNGFSKE
jgi:hypothetical protein